jgi:hypothetical protein
VNNKLVKALAALTLILGSVFATASPAAASGCSIFSLTSAGHTGHLLNGTTLWWEYSPIYTKPAPGCVDIQVRNIHYADTNGWTTMQVEFLHSNGTHASWGTAQVVFLDESTWDILATDVLTGTKFRVWNQSDDFTVTGQVMD